MRGREGQGGSRAGQREKLGCSAGRAYGELWSRNDTELLQVGPIQAGLHISVLIGHTLASLGRGTAWVLWGGGVACSGKGRGSLAFAPGPGGSVKRPQLKAVLQHPLPQVAGSPVLSWPSHPCLHHSPCSPTLYILSCIWGSFSRSQCPLHGAPQVAWLPLGRHIHACPSPPCGSAPPF